MPYLSYAEQKARIEALLARIQARLPELEAMLRELDEDEEDAVYRFFHQSWKVFNVQDTVKTACKLITEIGGELDRPCDYFQGVIKAGTEGEFDMERTNANWDTETEPILKAAWLTKYFLAQMVRYAHALASPWNGCRPAGLRCFTFTI